MAAILTENDLKIIKKLELEIAMEIKRVCELYDIKYSIAFGTLLGAVRHGGFIPWDDDIDIAMLRTEYDKFLEIAYKEMNSKFEIVNYETNANMGEPFTKVMLKNTVMLERFAKHANAPCGVFVDIFPYDNTPPNILCMAIHRFCNYELRKRILLANNYVFEKKGVKKLFYSLLQLTASNRKEKLIKAYRKNQGLYNNKKTKYVTALGGNYGYKKDTVLRSWFDDFQTIDFEGVSFSAFKHTKEFLNHYYSNYMDLPPVEHRISKHSVEALDLSAYGGRKLGNNDNY